MRNNWILHDYMQVNGGAERLVSTIARCIPNFSLGVSGIYSSYSSSSDLDGVQIIILGNIPKIFSRIPKALITFSNQIPCIENSDAVIYSGIYSPLAVKKQLRGKRIYYCHTTPRFALDRKQEYLEKFPYLVRPIVKFSIERYLKNYISSLQKMDLILTNSEHIRKRLNIQLGLTSKVVYPPIKVDKYKWIAQGDYYLSLGRLEKNKRIDLIIKSFINMPDKKLIVASGGSQFQYLKNLAIGAKNIFFTGWTHEEKLIELIGRSIACIYIPLDEDFGMSAVESMSAGKPVIGVAEGGMIETIIDRVTGLLLPHNPSIEDICNAVRFIDAPLALLMRNKCEIQANKFSEKRFINSIKSCI